MTLYRYVLLARLHFIKFEEGDAAGDEIKSLTVDELWTSGERRKEERSQPLVMHISLSFQPIWAKCGPACFCSRHTGRCVCVCVQGSEERLDTCQENSWRKAESH